MDIGSSGTYTIMFTDMVDSTAVRVALGEADADELRRRHDELLYSAVETNGGLVVKSTGDGLMAAFSSASSGVEAAISAQRAMARYRAGASALAPVEIRVGLSVGDVSAEDDDLFGTPVVEAARLESSAEAGEILASGLVRYLSRGRTEVAFEPAGELELKGLPDPVEAFRVPWDEGGLEASPLPLPSRLIPRRAWPFAGREQELGQLHQAWVDAREYGLAAAFVAGEPGIGKTRLLQEFCHELHAHGAVVALGSCSDGLSLAYRPFVEILHQLHRLEGPVGRLDDLTRASLAHLAPEYALADTSDVPADNDAARLRLFGAVTELFAGIAPEFPLVLVLDDLQWADPASLLLLRHLAVNTSTGPILVLGTFRDSEVGRGHPLADCLADLRRENMGERIPLAGLDTDEIRALVSGRATGGLDQGALDFVDSVGRESGGSPLYLTEIFRNLNETGVIAEVDGRWQLQSDNNDFKLPEGVREVIDRRLSRLSASVVETLTAASVIGLQFELDALVRLCDDDTDAVLASLETAVGARLVSEGDRHGEFEFSHAVVQRTLYESVSLTRRGRFHQALAELPPQVASIQTRAHHAYEAQASLDVTSSARLLLEAGQTEARRLAWESAAIQFRRALEVLGPGVERQPELAAEIQLGLGSVLRRADDPDAVVVLDAGSINARAAGRGDLMAQLAMTKLRPGWWFPEAGIVDEDLVAQLEEAAAGLDDDPTLRAAVLGATACALAFDDDRERRVRLLAEAEASLPADAGPDEVHAVRAHRWVSLWDPDTTMQRLELAEELEGLSVQRGSIEGRCQAAICRLHCLIELGRAEEIGNRLADAKELLAQASMPYFDWILSMMEDLLAILRVDPEAEARFAASHAIGAGANADADVAFGAQMFGLAVHRGTVGDLAPFIEIQVAETPGFPAWWAAFALSLAESGQESRSRSIFDELAAKDFAMPNNMTAPAAYCSLVRTAQRLDRPETAEALYGHLRPYSGRLDSMVGVGSLGPIDLFLAEAAVLMGRTELVEQHARAALELARRFDAVSCIRTAQDLLAGT